MYNLFVSPTGLCSSCTYKSELISPLPKSNWSNFSPESPPNNQPLTGFDSDKYY